MKPSLSNLLRWAAVPFVFAISANLGLASPPTDVNKAALSQPRILSYQSGASGFHTKTYAFDSGRELVFFDSQFDPKFTKEFIHSIQNQPQSKPAYLVITHANPDKFNGISTFKELFPEIKVITSRNVAAELPGVHAYKKYYFTEIAKSYQADTYPRLGPIDLTFQKTYTISLEGGMHVILNELTNAAVASHHVTASIPSLNQVVVGDIIHHKAHAWLEGPIINGKAMPDVAAWAKALDELYASYPRNPMVLAGRGKTVDLKAAVTEQKRYLSRAQTLVKDFLKKENIRPQDLQSAHAAAIYRKLSQRFASAYPDYEFAYMIEYGVYSFVGKLLEN
ncbi:MAG: hypothetical protein HRU19_12525 [Pseudobacteriovorax sp.]|nr:hypothetical protein [Pseudobacteriovorax sp.]